MLALFEIGEEYAPGVPPYNPSRDENACPGCLAHPCPDCAGCGAPASVALPAGEHAVSLCERCYSVVLEIRASAQEQRERMAPNTAAMIAGRQKLREREQEERQERQQERAQARTQARQQARRGAQGRNVTTRGAGILTARTTRQEAQTRQTRAGRPSRPIDRASASRRADRRELAPIASVASGTREHRGEEEAA